MSVDSWVNHIWSSLCSSVTFVDIIDEAAHDVLDTNVVHIGPHIYHYDRIIAEGIRKEKLEDKWIFQTAPVLRWCVAPRLQSLDASIRLVSSAPNGLQTLKALALGIATPTVKVVPGKQSHEQVGLTGLFNHGISHNILDHLRRDPAGFFYKLIKLVIAVALPIFFILFSFPFKSVVLLWIGFEIALAVTRFAVPLILQKSRLPQWRPV